MQIYCGGSPPFSSSIQGDAAAWDKDMVRSTAAAELKRQMSREEEDDGKGENEKKTSRGYL